MATGTSQPRAFSRPVLAVVAVVAIVIGGRLVLATQWNPFSRGQAPATRDSGLTVPADRLDFGEVWENSQFKWTLPIHNRLGHDLAFELAASCKCSAMEPRSLMIPAGQTREVRLTLDLTAKASQIPESERRDFAMIVRPVFDGEGGKTTAAGWTLRGRVRSAIRLERSIVDFGTSSELEQPVQPKKFLVTSFVALRQLECQSNSRLVSARVKQLNQSGHQFEVTITLSTLPTGNLDTKVFLVPMLLDSARLPGEAVVVKASIVPDCQASPPEAVFGARLIGNSADETINVYSLTRRRVTITNVRAESDGLEVTEIQPADAVSRSFRLKHRIKHLGPTKGRVLFRIESENSGSFDLVVPISYLGTGSPFKPD